jgi:hypothetical protein
MAKLIDITGQKFGRLLALELDPIRQHGKANWKCQCDCGKQVTVWGCNLRNGNSRSCGCLVRDTASDNFSTHKLSQTREYKIWKGIVQRCTNPKVKAYPRYGGRGVSICDAWRHSFEEFLAHVGQRPSSEHSIDRIKNDLGYEPGNVRWATDREQANNRHARGTFFIAK